MLLSGADIIVQTLIDLGVDCVFGYPGGQVIDIYDSLYKYRKQVTHVLTAHEQGAVHSADGYARASGKVGVCFATSGPGATNLVTGIATAFLDSVPMVAICGNVMTGQIGTDSFQEIDITGITLPITKHNYFVTDVNQLSNVIKQAFQIAQSGRPGPVLIDVPKNVQMAKCDYSFATVESDEPHCNVEKQTLKECADLINSAKRPYIYFGGGLVSSGAKAELIELAEKIDAVMGCSLMGLGGVPTDHPKFLGMQGMHGHYASSMAMNESDLIIALGVRFNDRVTGKRAHFATKSQIIQVDVDASELNKNITCTKVLCGDIKCVLRALLPLVCKKQQKAWSAQVAELKQKENSFADVRQGLTPKNAILTLNDFLSENTPVATDVGQHQMWTAQNVKLQKERRFISSGGLGAMGFGMGGAMGASLATGERAVLVTGDGSFGMNLTELATAVKYKIPLVILLFNNGVLGMVRQMQSLFYKKHYSQTTLERKTDFVAVAKGFGAQAERVFDLDGLEKSLKKAFASKGVYLIDCAIEKDELVLPMMPNGGTINDLITKVGD